MMIQSTLRRSLMSLGLLASLPFAPLAWAQAVAPSPEAPTGRTLKSSGTATKDMVAAANPLAAQAGREILAAGGSAVDAAIAVQLVLNLVEPQSSGIGGGAFMVFWDGRTMTTLDGRETAPAAAKPERFLGPDGKPMKFYDAVVGGRSVGVPGTPRLLEMAHKNWGKLSWQQVIEPAARLAEEGFTISPRLNGLLTQEKYLQNDPVARAYFYEADGKPKAVGTVLKNPAFAKTLRTVAEKGAEAFYTGEIAQDIVATVTGHPTNPGDMTLDDLKGYRVQEREALCGSYRVYRVCGMGPPSSGQVAVQQIMGVLETQDMAAMKPGPDAAHLFAEAGRLAYADRALFLADPAFVNVPVKGLTDPGYIKSRAALVDPNRSMGKAKPGDPPFQKTFLWGPSEGIEYGTSHISIVDRNGNAVSMTTTIEDGFGARIMTKSGFLLNNELTDFSFATTEDGKPIANRVEAGKRPRSSMAPTMVLDGSGKLYAVVGSPGGSLIPNYVAKTLVGILDWKLDPQVAADLPNMGSRNGPTELEAGTEAEAWKAALEAKGHEVKLIDQNSGIHAIVVTPAGLVGGADSRREGVAIGN
ncbi:gamma-glutamyltranspeptidase/glutathione hydrolase [Microvirga lupini]|uniref:Glutathione hydrolase proenzyme n=1 Tax=Microvirga lupini TaxID=420324 RepID=A0A7W4VQX5_9HYPH|nr:gamma-glutamyltransferase [Microvirga lupini]MBB3021663.1 gamma-glutamyltranspeptidase/glutathione hydrolase [Microvirga lupini]